MRYPVKVQALNMDSPADGHEFMSIRFRVEGTYAEPEYHGMEFALPYIHDPAQAKHLWEELANAMTKLEAYIGRNSD